MGGKPREWNDGWRNLQRAASVSTCGNHGDHLCVTSLVLVALEISLTSRNCRCKCDVPTGLPEWRCGADEHHFFGSHVLSSAVQSNVGRETARQEVTVTFRVIYGNSLYEF